jgi:hypothetical protein
MITTHSDRLEELNMWRKRADFASDLQSRLFSEMKNSEAYKAAEIVRQIAMTKRDELEADLRQNAIEEFTQTGDKHPCPALDIREMTHINYDPDIALEYCKKSMQGALQLDRTKFEKAAAALGLDFVTISKVPKATIATNLNKFTTSHRQYC